jgi:ribonuclease-3
MSTLERDLEYTFKDSSLLQKALTHPSALTPGQGVDFERLEFLGDRVLGLIIANWLFEEFPIEKEGDLAKRFAGLVRKETLVEVAQALNLDRAMVMKREKSSSQVKRLETLLSDGCEALIAAIYLDGGLPAASDFIHRFWKDYFIEPQDPPRDPKSILQEWIQAQGKSHPQYIVVESSGPAHAPLFIVEVVVEGLEPVKGQGSSKRLAEKDAAQQMLNEIANHD